MPIAEENAPDSVLARVALGVDGVRVPVTDPTLGTVFCPVTVLAPGESLALTMRLRPHMLQQSGGIA